MKFYTRKRRMPAVIIVSLIDILAILLIFVIVTTTFRRDQPEVVIKLPESSTATAAPNPAQPELLRIDEKGEIYFKQKQFTAEAVNELKPMLAEYKDSSGKLAIEADKAAPFGTIIRVLDVLKEVGVKNLPAFTESRGK